MSEQILFEGKVGRKYCKISSAKWIIGGKEYDPQEVSSVVWSEYKPSKFTTYSGYILFIMCIFLMIVDTVEFWEILGFLMGISIIVFKIFIKSLFYMRADSKFGGFKFLVFSKTEGEIMDLLFACDKCLSQNEETDTSSTKL